jgi:hypothetical protein
MLRVGGGWDDVVRASSLTMDTQVLSFVWVRRLASRTAMIYIYTAIYFLCDMFKNAFLFISTYIFTHSII